MPIIPIMNENKEDEWEVYVAKNTPDCKRCLMCVKITETNT